MRNYISKPDVVTMTAPAGGIVSGQGHLFGGLFGVACASAAAGAKVAVSTWGVFSLPKKTGAGLTEGQAVYWSEADKAVTGTASGNTKIGYALQAASADASAAEVRVSV